MRGSDRRGIRVTAPVGPWVVAGLAGAAAGQNSWVFEVEYSDPAGVINSPDDTATVSLWAEWDANYYAFNTARLDVTADDLIDSGVWLKSRTVMRGPGSSDGTVQGERVLDIIPSQLYLPPNFLADTSNPILVWEGTWGTEVLLPRDVPVWTLTEEFWLYDDDAYFFDVVDSLAEGSTVIRVVPACPTASMALISAAVLRRRRKSAPK
jgi:hypothetical protein